MNIQDEINVMLLTSFEDEDAAAFHRTLRVLRGMRNAAPRGLLGAVEITTVDRRDPWWVRER